jgi:signal transduction histidine kinase
VDTATAARSLSMLKHRASWHAGTRSVRWRSRAAQGGRRDFTHVWPVFAFFAVVVSALAGLPRVPALPASAALIAVVAAAVGAIQRSRRPWVIPAGAVATAGVSLADTVGHQAEGADTPVRWLLVETAFTLVITVQVTRTSPARLAWPAGLIVAAAIVASPSRIGELPASSRSATVIGACSCWALLTMCAIAVGRYLRHLDEARNRSVATARREQRLQLAQDLHDWLAHEVTGIVLEAQAARVDGGDPGTALAHIEEAGVRALDAMDRAIQFMRDTGESAGPSAPERTCLADLREMVHRFAMAGPVGVRLEMEDLDDIGPGAAAVAHRVVVEALTNVRRHAASVTVVRIRLTKAGGNLVVSVTDDGEHGPASRVFGRRGMGGFGLPGLTEQVEALGGAFTAGPSIPRGWSVCAVVPETC